MNIEKQIWDDVRGNVYDDVKGNVWDVIREKAWMSASDNVWNNVHSKVQIITQVNVHNVVKFNTKNNGLLILKSRLGMMYTKNSTIMSGSMSGTAFAKKPGRALVIMSGIMSIAR